MRAFASFLGMSSATLSRVLSNSQEISLSACKKIIKKLRLHEQECMIFVRSVADEKCHRAYRVLSATMEYGNLFPHERNLLFVSDLNHSCIYLNDVAANIREQSLDEQMAKIMTHLGFNDDVVDFIEDCLEKVVANKEAMKRNLPIQTTVGTLSVESLFSPLLGKEGAQTNGMNYDLIRSLQ